WFLGGIYTVHMVEDALSIIAAVDGNKVDAKAVNQIKEPSKAAEFVRAVKRIEKVAPVSAKAQREVAERVVKEEVPRAKIEAVLRKQVVPPKQAKPPDFGKFVDRLAKRISDGVEDALPKLEQVVTF